MSLVPMNGLLVCATKPEWSELKKSLLFERVDGALPLYQLKNQNIQLLQVGIGPDMAQKNLQAYFEHHQPSWMLHFGLSGGLDPRLRVGDCLLAENIYSSVGSLNTDLKWQSTIKSLKVDLVGNLFSGNQFSSATVLATPKQKQEAFQKYQCLSVDMESFWVAQAAQQRNIPYYFLRAVFDTATEDLSALANAHTITKEGQLSPTGLATSLVKNPKLLLSLPQYQRQASIANKNLAKLILEFLKNEAFIKPNHSNQTT